MRTQLRLFRKPSPWVPDRHNPNSNDDRTEFQRTEEDLVRAQITKNALGGLSQAEDGTKIHQNAGGSDSEHKRLFESQAGAELCVLSKRDHEEAQQREENCECESLKRKPTE